LNAYANFLAFMALYDRLQAPPVTPEERDAILGEAIHAVRQQIQPHGCLELANRLVADLNPKEKPIVRSARKSR